MIARATALLAALSLLAGCAPPEPIRIGFIGGLSGRVADLGIGARNAIVMAVDDVNAAGGIAGRPLQLLVRDDQHDPATAARMFDELRTAGVVAVIGPMTSQMALAIVPLANQHRLPLIAPTVTTRELTGLDDYFLRVIGDTPAYAGAAARHQHAQGRRRVAIAWDLSNRSYAEAWRADYTRTFSDLGGQVVAAVPFTSAATTDLSAVAADLLRARPDGIVIVANSVDTALLAQRVRQRAATIPLAGAEWGATERLIELGGRAIEGMTLAQFFDRASTAPAYLALRDRFHERYAQAPGFAGVAAWDAVQLLLAALRQQPEARHAELRAALLGHGRFDGVQGPITLDATGDTQRTTYLTVVRDGRFVKAE